MRRLLTLFALAAPAAVHAQVTAPAAGARSTAILVLKGSDTVLVERLRRSERTVTAEIIGRGMPRITVVADLTADHRVAAATFHAHGAGAPPDAPALQSGELRFDGDSVRLALRSGGEERRLVLPTRPGALLLVNNDFSVVEQSVRRARAAGVTRLTQPVFTLTGGTTLEAQVELFARDSVRFTVAGNVTVASIDAAGHVTGGYLPGQGIVLRVLAGAEAAALDYGRPDYAAPPGAPYLAEEVRVATPAGHLLAGTLTRPREASGKVPAVITITGSGAQDRDEMIPLVSGYRLFRQVADTLGRRGIAVLRLDDRGVGGSGGDVNGTSADFADDIRAAIAFLRGRPEIDPARIALVGHSEGGMIAPMVAATDSRLAAVVLMAGPSETGRRIIDYQLRQAVLADPAIPPAARDSATAALTATFDSTTGRLPWMRWFLAHDPLPTLRRVKQPVLILHGETDRQVTADQAPAMAGALRDAGNRRVTVRVFPERNHLFLRDADGSPGGYARLPTGRVDGEVMGALAEWLVEVLQAR